MACTGPGCTCQDSLSQDLRLDRSVSHVMRYWWPCLGPGGAKLSSSHPSESRAEWAGVNSRWVNSTFPWIFPKLCNIMHEWGLAIWDYLITNQKSWVSPKNQVAGLREKIITAGREFCFHFYLSLIWKWDVKIDNSDECCAACEAGNNNFLPNNFSLAPGDALFSINNSSCGARGGSSR